jgi:hypothetical protein
MYRSRRWRDTPYSPTSISILLDGDPLDAFGDLHAMNELKTWLKPNGVVCVAVLGVFGVCVTFDVDSVAVGCTVLAA